MNASQAADSFEVRLSKKMLGKKKYVRYREKKKIKKREELLQEYTEFSKSKSDDIDATELPEKRRDCKERASDLEFEVPSPVNSESSSDEVEVIDYKIPESTEVDEVHALRQWIVECNIAQKHADKLLKILRARLLPSLPGCTKTFLKSNIKFPIERMLVSDGSFGQFIYLGIREKLEKIVNVDLHGSNILELIFNIDGFSPFTSSSLTIWPTLCKIYAKPDVYKPFTVSVYSGNGKPKNPVDYLKKFLQEINALQANGMDIKHRHFQVRIKFFVCDMPARCYLKCVVGHVAFRACERCLILGRKESGVTVFVGINAENKTDQDFLEYAHPQCHTGVSPLIAMEPPVNMVSQFVLDPMHMLYLGCTKRIMEYLLASSTHNVRLSGVLKKELQRRTEKFQQDIPEEFPRKMRPTNDYGKYKAVEYKFFLLYAAPIVLKELVSNEIYEHLMLFSVACRLLCEENPRIHIQQARKYLRIFVEKAPAVYGITFMSLNVHNLIHLCDDVERFDCNINELSAFAFESYLGEIGRALRSPKHVVAQYCRRLWERKEFDEQPPSIPPNLTIKKQTKKKILKLKYNGMILSDSHPNNTILLQDGSVAEIQGFTKSSDGSICIGVKKFLKQEAIFNYPCDSSILKMYEINKLSSADTIVPLDHIQQKFVKFQMNFSTTQNRKRIFVVPLMH